ncbi:MAG: BamA/TamA family outer membrane protein [Bacteroidia bacterium]|nr:BamA/TamA family outer membrane protein [Bacteroidia bacterium]
MKNYRSKILIYLSLIGWLLILFSCNIRKSLTKFLKGNQYVVAYVDIKDKDKAKLNKDEIMMYVKQKPNSMILSNIPFNAWLYFQIDTQKLREGKEKRKLRIEEINKKRIQKAEQRNQKRIAKGKKPKEPKLLNEDKPTWRERLREIAEEPVIYDSLLTKQSVEQIKRYLQTKGFFYAEVIDKVIFNPAFKTAYVTYEIKANRRKYISQINYDIKDSLIFKLIRQDSIHRLLKPGIPFDIDILRKERERISEYLQNNGYYYFAPEFIQYDADSVSKAPDIIITMHLNLFPTHLNESSDSIVFVNHPRYKIKNIYFISEFFEGSFKNAYFKDTLKVEDIYFLYNEPLLFNPHSIASQIKMHSNDIFNKEVAEETYRRLTNVGIYRSVLIQFDDIKEKDSTGNFLLNAYIITQPIKKQYVSLEVEGTNTSANLGVDGSFIYSHRSLFGGGEKIDFKITGALIAQKQLYSSQQSLTQSNLGSLTDINNITNLNENTIKNTFNTIQIGSELKISIPRDFFPFSLLKFKKDAARTYFNVSTNYQSRIEFARTISNLSYGFQFYSLDHKYRFDLIPAEVYLVRAYLSSEFQQNLIAIKDYMLLNSFITHITNDLKLVMTYNTGIFNSKINRLQHYLRVSFTGSGLLLRELAPYLKLQKDSLGRYYVMNVPFAHFLKGEADYRVYVPVYKKSKMVYRIAGGIGVPLKNLNTLPYEQSFFAGGPNSVRAWRSRSIGPGAYMPIDNARYDKIGDILIEGNAEFRFNIISSYYGALFVDAGNIWLLSPRIDKPNGEFNPLRFWKEFAVGAGIGFRWDFEYFILRLDWAMPIKDPKYPEGQRFTFDKQPLKQSIFNFGIGYPF